MKRLKKNSSRASRMKGWNEQIEAIMTVVVPVTAVESFTVVIVRSLKKGMAGGRGVG